MALNIKQKKTIVAEVKEEVSDALSVIAANYRGLTVSELNVLRKTARDKEIYLRIIPNRLAKKALEDTSFDCLNEALIGPIILGFSKKEPNASARLFRDFMKEHEKLEVMAIVITKGQLLSAKDLSFVADLPSYSEAISMLMSVMKAPINKFVQTINEPHAKLVRTIAAVRDQKQAA